MVHSVEPSGPSSRKIMKIFEEKIDKKGINWKSVYGETKDFYYKEINPIYLMQFNKNFKFIFLSKLFLELLNVQLIYILIETMYLG